MSEQLRDLKRTVEAVRDHAGALRITSEEDVAAFTELLESLEEAEAQLAGTRLHLIGEARLGGGAQVLDRVRASSRTTVTQASASLRLAGVTCPRS